MNQVQVKMLCQAITSQYGTLETDTILRTDEAFAKHLVDDCRAAEYVTAPQPADDASTAKPVRIEKTTKKPKASVTGPAPSATFADEPAPAPETEPAAAANHEAEQADQQDSVQTSAQE